MNSITDLLYSNNEQYDGQKVPGFVQGVVIENNNKEYMGMVKVEFTVWENGKNICEWVRLMSPYTGAAYAHYLVPEIDEIVLVGFIGGSLKRPFVLGSLYPADAQIVKDSFHENNYLKVFKTKAGTNITVNDEDSKQSVSVTTPKGAKIVIEDENETCTISDEGEKNSLFIDFKSGEITLTADKKITLSAGSAEFVLDGSGNTCTTKAKDINLEGSGNVTVKATSNATIEGTSKAELKGMTASVSGTQQSELKGSMQTTISGGIVKIN